jgi:hypothetical protein
MIKIMDTFEKRDMERELRALGVPKRLLTPATKIILRHVQIALFKRLGFLGRLCMRFGL